MKMLLAIAATVALSATAALACDFDKVNASADVDRKMTTASIATDEQRATDAVLLKKTEGLPEDVTVAE